MKEGKTIEFKETTKSATFLKTVSAFANYGDGCIFFGVRDSGELVGIPNAREACLDLENKINDSINPVPDYSLHIREDGVICLEVYEGLFKPYTYKGKAFRRSDTATIEVDRLEYSRLILEGRNQSYEEMRSKKQDLSFSCLEKELQTVMGVSSLNKDILKTLELYSDKEGFNNAAAMLADINDFMGIEIIRFGETIDQIMYRETIEKISVLQQFHKTLDLFRLYYQFEQIDGIERKQKENVPEKAFREAVANALVHRTWDVSASIRIGMFADRIEISSPGGLPAGVGKDDYLNGQLSILRNPILGNVFYRLRYIEKFGTGILRIRKEYTNSLQQPQFAVFENSIKIVLPVLNFSGSFTTQEAEIVKLLRNGIVLKRAEIESATGMGKDAVIRNLNRLIKQNIVEKEGSGRGTVYKLKYSV